MRLTHIQQDKSIKTQCTIIFKNTADRTFLFLHLLKWHIYNGWVMYANTTLSPSKFKLNGLSLFPGHFKFINFDCKWCSQPNVVNCTQFLQDPVEQRHGKGNSKDKPLICTCYTLPLTVVTPNFVGETKRWAAGRGFWRRGFRKAEAVNWCSEGRLAEHVNTV